MVNEKFTNNCLTLKIHKRPRRKRGFASVRCGPPKFFCHRAQSILSYQKSAPCSPARPSDLSYILSELLKDQFPPHDPSHAINDIFDFAAASAPLRHVMHHNIIPLQVFVKPPIQASTAIMQLLNPAIGKHPASPPKNSPHLHFCTICL